MQAGGGAKIREIDLLAMQISGQIDILFFFTLLFFH